MICILYNFTFFFFNDTATTEIYTLSLHDALPICSTGVVMTPGLSSASKLPNTASLTLRASSGHVALALQKRHATRSEEHTSELQSLRHLVCRLLLEKKKK